MSANDISWSANDISCLPIKDKVLTRTLKFSNGCKKFSNETKHNLYGTKVEKHTRNRSPKIALESP